jgi:hemolysin activation/secretion protein
LRLEYRVTRIPGVAALLSAFYLSASVFAADAPPAPHFDVHEYRVLGNTVLTNRQIEGVLYPLLGDGKTMDDVQAARTALENAYHTLGYGTVYVDIPQQEIVDDVVRLRVTEGRIRLRTISGARYFSEGKILEQLPATQPGSVPRIPELQAQLNALNAQTPDRSVVPVLKAGPDPGTTDLALNVDDHLPLHGSIDFNNQYTADTRPLRATVNLSYDDLFAVLDSISAQFSTSPQNTGQVQVLNVAYGFHPLDFGLRPSVSYTNSASDVTSIGTLGVLGDGQIYSGRLAFPATTLPGNVQNLTLGIDYKHFRNTINLAATDNPGTAVSDIEPIAYANLSLGYSGFWSWTRADGKIGQSLAFDVSANGGPRGITNETLNFDNSRFQARGNYAYLRSDLAYTLLLPKEVQLILKVAGQAAEDPLVVYEQYALTGADAVRGYLEAEVLTDDGIRETVQFQSPPLRHKSLVLADGFLFFDNGHAHYLAPLPGQPTDTDLRSVGAGFDLLPGYSNVNGTFTWAYPLLSGPDTRAHDSRFLFDIKGSF